MKQKYTITISDVQMNVISDESPEAVEALVGLVDRKMREIIGGSSMVPKSEAALLCALDYCSERIKSQRKVKALETKLAYTETALEELELENEQLRKELDELRMMTAK
ncbi:MAG: cell division protein ZapA [Ruminococcaceae bacterium]|nr:cell division protein ZapA [Oscillospiraceae bacterium]